LPATGTTGPSFLSIADEEDAAYEIQVAEVQALAFAHADAGAVEEFKHRAVALPALGGGIGTRDQAPALHLI
jgi:hypothetical protein